MSYGNNALAGGAAGDRRDSPRRICRVRVSVTLPGHPPLPGTTIDIGRDGMAILLGHPLPPGVQCALAFNVFAKGGVQRIDATGQTLMSVFMRDTVRVSFSFSKISLDAQRAVSEFVSFGATR